MWVFIIVERPKSKNEKEVITSEKRQLELGLQQTIQIHKENDWECVKRISIKRIVDLHIHRIQSKLDFHQWFAILHYKL